MPTFVPDTVEGSELSYDLVNPVKARGGLVTGLSGDASTALESCIHADGMPALGDTKVVEGKTLTFSRLEIKALESDTARVRLIYDTIAGTQTAYTVTSRSYLTSYQTNLDPSTKDPLRIEWQDANDAANHIPEDFVTFTFMRVMREVRVEGIRLGKVPAPSVFEGKVGMANQEPWRDLDIGAWVVTEGGVEAAKYAGWYRFHLAALTKNSEDWSEIGVLRDQRTGRYADADPADIRKLKALPYKYGRIGGAPNDLSGAIRVGPFPLTNYAALFGF